MSNAEAQKNRILNEFLQIISDNLKPASLTVYVLIKSKRSIIGADNPKTSNKLKNFHRGFYACYTHVHINKDGDFVRRSLNVCK